MHRAILRFVCVSDPVAGRQRSGAARRERHKQNAGQNSPKAQYSVGAGQGSFPMGL
jgi:hypothetical protein